MARDNPVYRGVDCAVRTVGGPMFYAEQGERKRYRNRWKKRNPNPKPRFKKGGGKRGRSRG